MTFYLYKLFGLNKRLVRSYSYMWPILHPVKLVPKSPYYNHETYIYNRLLRLRNHGHKAEEIRANPSICWQMAIENARFLDLCGYFYPTKRITTVYGITLLADSSLPKYPRSRSIKIVTEEEKKLEELYHDYLHQVSGGTFRQVPGGIGELGCRNNM